MPFSNFQPIRLLDPDFRYKFTYLMANSVKKPADLDLHCLQRQGISGSAGQGLILSNFEVYSLRVMNALLGEGTL